MYYEEVSAIIVHWHGHHKPCCSELLTISISTIDVGKEERLMRVGCHYVPAHVKAARLPLSCPPQWLLFRQQLATFLRLSTPLTCNELDVAV